jgi:RimJ/RimL family protein N-acetyltransferase
LRDYHRSVDGRIRDALIMSILRRDWVRRHRL